MSNISVNITELKQLLEATPASHNIMLVATTELVSQKS